MLTRGEIWGDAPPNRLTFTTAIKFTVDILDEAVNVFFAANLVLGLPKQGGCDNDLLDSRRSALSGVAVRAVIGAIFGMALAS